MSSPKRGSVVVLVGTRKGAFVFRSDARRKSWAVAGPHFPGQNVFHFILDLRDPATLFAATYTEWWGGDVQRSRNSGRTWQGTKGGVRYSEDAGLSVKCVWHVRPGRASPAWSMRASSAATMADASGSRETRGRAPTSCPLSSRNSASACTSSCKRTVHPRVLYQQNHCGVYRSESAGDSWADISSGLPSRFGFPIAVHPREPRTIWVVPLVSAEMRACPKGCLAVYRSTTGGRTWQKQTRGLPTRNAHLTILREAMSADSCDPAGIYFGTETGQLFHSRDAGRQWHLLADFLPPILSVEAAAL